MSGLMSFCPRELHPITPPMAGTLLTAIDLWLTSLYSSSRGSGNRSRRGPEARLSPSTSHTPNTHTCTHTHMPCPSWPDLDLPLEKEVVLLAPYDHDKKLLKLQSTPWVYVQATGIQKMALLYDSMTLLSGG